MSDTSIQVETPPVVPASTTTPKKAMLIVFMVMFLDLLGFGIVLPLLPLYGIKYLEPLIEGGAQSRFGGAILGLLLSSFSAMQFLFAPVWGRISDRVGRRPILLIGLVGSVVFYALFGFASDMPANAANAWIALTLLFVARIGAGVSGATISTAQAVIADSTTPERRKHGMALIGAAFGIGFAFGPLIGAGTMKYFPNNLGANGYVASGLSFIALLTAVVIMPETRRFGEASGARRKWFDTNAVRMALSNPAIAPVVWIFFLVTLGFASFEVTLAPLNRDILRLPNDDNFLVFAYVGFVLMLTQGVLYRRLANKISEPTFMAAGIVFMGLGLLSLGGVTWMAGRLDEPDVPEWLFAWAMVSLTLAVVGFAFLTPSAHALVSRRSDPERQGEFLGVNQSAASMARILGPIFGMVLYEINKTHLLPYLFGAVILIGMLPLIPRIRRGEVQATTV